MAEQPAVVRPEQFEPAAPVRMPEVPPAPPARPGVAPAAGPAPTAAAGEVVLRVTVPWYLSSFDPQVPGVAPLTRAGTVVADANVAAVFDQAKAHGVGIEQE